MMMTAEQRKGWRRAYLALLHTVTVICILIGSLWHIGSWIFRDTVGRWFSPMASRATVGGSESGIEAFDSIHAALGMGDLTIIYGEDYGISYQDYPESREPSYRWEDGTLVIEQSGEWSLFGRDAFSGGGKVVVTIPQDASVSVDLAMDMGSVELSGLTLGNADIQASMGSVTLKRCAVETLSAEADMGAVTLQDTSFTQGSFVASMGSIMLKNAEFDTASCESDMGSVEVSGTFGDLTASCSMGSIKVETKNEDAAMMLTADMGSVRVNGRDYGQNYSSKR